MTLISADQKKREGLTGWSMRAGPQYKLNSDLPFITISLGKLSQAFWDVYKSSQKIQSAALIEFFIVPNGGLQHKTEDGQHVLKTKN